MWYILGIIAIVFLLVIVAYNNLVSMRNRVDEAWSDIEVQLKRRYDLIPNIVNTVKGYAQHEAGTLEKVIQARNQAMAAHSMQEHAAAENQLAGMVKGIFALAEAYPDLKANTNFQQLQLELSDTENKIQASRRFYNGNVRDFNTMVESVPSNIIAGMFNFKKREFFDIAENEKAVPEVKF
ncbi:MAG: LemA family protein [Candidatus Paceibacterota bacterium]